MALPGFFRPSRNRFVFDSLAATKTACRSGVRPVRDPTRCGLPFKHPQIWEPFLHHSAPFLALSQYGFVVYQPLTTMNCTSGTNRTLAPPWTLDFGLWTLDFDPELLRASAAIRTYRGLSVIFDFFRRPADAQSNWIKANQSKSRLIKVKRSFLLKCERGSAPIRAGLPGAGLCL